MQKWIHSPGMMLAGKIYTGDGKQPRRMLAEEKRLARLAKLEHGQKCQKTITVNTLHIVP